MNVTLTYVIHVMLRAETRGGPFVNTERSPRLHMLLIICWAAERLLDPQERKCMSSVSSYLFC